MDGTVVELAQQVARAGPGAREAAQGLAGAGHRGDRPDPVPGDVPHHEQQVAVGHRQRVVPVPADLVAAPGRAVPHGDVDARRFGQPLVWRQERVLQPGGELVFRRGPGRQRVGLMPGDEDAVAERGGPQVGHVDRLRAAGEQPADPAGTCWPAPLASTPAARLNNQPPEPG